MMALRRPQSHSEVVWISFVLSFYTIGAAHALLLNVVLNCADFLINPHESSGKAPLQWVGIGFGAVILLRTSCVYRLITDQIAPVKKVIWPAQMLVESALPPAVHVHTSVHLRWEITALFSLCCLPHHHLMITHKRCWLLCRCIPGSQWLGRQASVSSAGTSQNKRCCRFSIFRVKLNIWRMRMQLNSHTLKMPPFICEFLHTSDDTKEACSELSSFASTNEESLHLIILITLLLYSCSGCIQCVL